MAKSTLRKIGEGVAWTTGSTILIKFIGIAYVILVLSSITVAEYGLVELALSIVPLLGVLSLAGLQPVVTADLVLHKTNQAYKEMRYLFSAFVSIKTVLGLLAAALLYALSIIFTGTFPAEAIVMVQLLTITFVIGPVRSALVLLLTVDHQFRTLASFRLVEEITKLILVFVLLKLFAMGPIGVVVAFVITDIVIALLFLPTLHYVSANTFGGSLWSKGFFDPLFVIRHHAKWSVFQSTLHLFSNNIRPWIIQAFLGTQAVGIYATATGIYQHVLSLGSVTGVIAPIIPEYTNAPEKISQLLHAGVKYQILLLAGVVMGTLICIPWLIDTFFASYREALPLFMLLIVSLIPDTFSRVYEAAFHAFRLQKSLFWANIVKTIMVVGLLPIMLLAFGISGVAVEFLLTQVVYAVTRYRVLLTKVLGYKLALRDFVRFTPTDRLVFNLVRKNIVSTWRSLVNRYV